MRGVVVWWGVHWIRTASDGGLALTAPAARAKLRAEMQTWTVQTNLTPKPRAVWLYMDSVHVSPPYRAGFFRQDDGSTMDENETAFLRVARWDETFENNQSRVIKDLKWVPFPNKHDSDGYTELMDHPEGYAHYAAWVVIVQVASKCNPRGTLVREGARPHDAASLARISRVPETIIENAIPRLILVGWLERISVDGNRLEQITQEGAATTHQSAQKGREGKGIEEKGKEQKGTEEALGDKSPVVVSPLPKKRNEYPEAFERFWKAFPAQRRKAKPQTLKKWETAVATLLARNFHEEDDAEGYLIMRAADYRLSEEGRGEFVRGPEPWLNQQAWEDEPEAWRRPEATEPSQPEYKIPKLGGEK